MKYSFTCPDDEHMINVEAQSDDEAVEKLMASAGEHVSQRHPEMADMPESRLREIVRSEMRKV